MKPELSIIIPCYNCEKTLEEAVNSCFDQGLTNFEIVLVDDKSLDRTLDCIKHLSQKYPIIRYFSNDKNLGGGATRNKAVTESRADIVFCLDSDDILPCETLSSMYDFMKEKHCDAVGIHKSIKFSGSDKNNITKIDEFGYSNTDKPIPFESLFEYDGIRCPLYSTFMITKQAFNIAGGYPESHGFDTQGLAWRFLSNGLTAFTCPNASYLHRIEHGQSYYIREYNSGKVNLNWFYILEEHLFLFDKSITQLILSYNLGQIDGNIFDYIKKQKPRFNTDYILHNSKDIYARKIEDTSVSEVSSIDLYWLGVYQAYKKEFQKALVTLDSALVNSNTDLEIKSAIQKKKSIIISMVNFGDDKEKINQKVSDIYKISGRNSFENITKRIAKKILQKIQIYIGPFEDRNWNPLLILGLVHLHVKKLIKKDFHTADQSEDTSTPLDIVIPTLGQDLELLETSIKSTSLLRHIIKNIYIVAPWSQKLSNFCIDHSCILIDESTVLPYTKDKLGYIVSGKDRNGWLFQQLLKISSDSFVQSENYLVLDSDTVIVSPYSFISRSKFIFQESTEWNAEYFKMFERMFGYRAKNKLSFVCHMMIFNKSLLTELKQELYEKHHKSWDAVIIDNINHNQYSGFSEFETYGNWMYIHHKNKINKVPFYNQSITRDKLVDISKIQRRYSKYYTSVSFHTYVNKIRL